MAASGRGIHADIVDRLPARGAENGGMPMLGLMQDWPLLCHRIIDHAASHHPDRPVISRSVEGPARPYVRRQLRLVNS